MRRVLIAALAATAALGVAAPAASAHATLLQSVPRAGSRPATSPARVVLTFSEPVQILRASDVSVVDGRGRPVGSGPPRSDPRDPRRVTVPLRTQLVPDSYTVRYRVISADSHEVDDALVFGLAQARLRAPVVRGAGGLSEAGPWAVAARFTELAALGLLLGLLGFRWLVWGPALDRARRTDTAELAAAASAGRRLFWRGFWASAGLAGLAETFVLAAKSAVVFHTGIGPAITDPAAAYRLVAASRFGDLIGWRGGLLGALAAAGLWAWSHEAGGAAPRRGPAALVGGLSVAMLALLSAQGHASQAPVAPLSVAADAVHLTAAAIWIGGLPCLAAVLARAPARLASDVLARFSRVALVAVVLVGATGAIRLAGGLSHVPELWTTDYGRSVLTKVALLLPIAVLALRNRRLIRRPGAATLRAARRNVQRELALALGIVVVAAVLVAQVPGRSAPQGAKPRGADSGLVARAAACRSGSCASP
jgi:copper transport protein